MRLTKHAEIRSRQRGFSTSSLEMIKKHGRCERAPGGCKKFILDSKAHQSAVGELKRQIQSLVKAKNGTMIVGENNKVITTYKG